MKRVWFAVIFLLVSAVLCAVEQHCVNKFYNELSVKIDLAEKDTDKVNDVVDYWDEKNDLIYTLTNHIALDDLSAAIHALKKADEKPDLEKVRALLTVFYENQRITFANIL